MIHITDIIFRRNDMNLCSQRSAKIPPFIIVALLLLILNIPAYGEVTARVSINSLGMEGNNHSYSPSISGDGRTVR